MLPSEAHVFRLRIQPHTKCVFGLVLDEMTSPFFGFAVQCGRVWLRCSLPLVQVGSKRNSGHCSALDRARCKRTASDCNDKPWSTQASRMTLSNVQKVMIPAAHQVASLLYNYNNDARNHTV
eukprot:6103784-Amphidinium_carterae.2